MRENVQSLAYAGEFDEKVKPREARLFQAHIADHDV
jgi:hypothetical protein